MKNMYRLLEWTINPAAYQDPYYYFHAVRGDLADVCYCTGFFLLMHRRSRLRYAAILPIGVAMSRIIWMGSVTSNQAYHAFSGWSNLVWGGLVAVLWVLLFDYLMDHHFHKVLRPLSTSESAADAPGLTAEKKLEMIRPQLRRLRTVLTQPK